MSLAGVLFALAPFFLTVWLGGSVLGWKTFCSRFQGPLASSVATEKSDMQLILDPLYEHEFLSLVRKKS